MVNLRIDGKEIQAPEGRSLLQVCLENDIYVPNLCWLAEMDEPVASCRLCFVEIDGRDRPVSSCAVQAAQGLVVRTDTSEVRALQRSALQLLLSVHDLDCAHCPANKQCELQRIARFLGVALKPKRLEKTVKNLDFDEGHPVLSIDHDKCVLCGRCVWICRQSGYPILTMARRGIETYVSTYGLADDPETGCRGCLDCARACPVGAIRAQESG
ncbi:MAG: (2Fe-2S)-binding protein [Proteobacteria bacterium]|nr:(2Fe-2S)-binding protein [Pseudomonadota bacterium]